MKQERWKVALAVIFLLASGFWYSHLYYDVGVKSTPTSDFSSLTTE